jgi:hypothetical protein
MSNNCVYKLLPLSFFLELYKSLLEYTYTRAELHFLPLKMDELSLWMQIKWMGSGWLLKRWSSTVSLDSENEQTNADRR